MSTPLARLKEQQRNWEDQPRDDKGQWESGGGSEKPSGDTGSVGTNPEPSADEKAFQEGLNKDLGPTGSSTEGIPLHASQESGGAAGNPGVQDWQTGGGVENLPAEGKADAFAEKAISGGSVMGETQTFGANHIPVGEAVAYYEGNGYSTINEVLRSGEALPTGASPETIAPYREAIDSAMAASKTTEDMVSFRGLQSDWTVAHADGPALQVGSTVSDKGYVSTSLREAPAAEFAQGDPAKPSGTIAEIHIPKGSEALSMNNALAGQATRSESEVVLPHDAHFEVTAVSHGTNFYGQPVAHVSMTYTGHG